MGIAAGFRSDAAAHASDELTALALKLKAYLPAMQKVVATARRTRLDGEKVPAADRAFSLFDQHSQLIQRGRREKPVEFGRKVLLCPDRREVHQRLRGPICQFSLRQGNGRRHQSHSRSHNHAVFSMRLL